MDTQQGVTLDRYLREKGPLDPAQVSRIALQLALQVGGHPSIVHPGRILVSRSGSVRLLPPPAEDLSLPAIVEFPSYVSPEVIHGAEVDSAAELYALGCTIFELLTGAPPYVGKDPKRVLRGHVEEPVPDVRKAVPNLPESLAMAVRDLIAKEPELRIGSGEELVRRLKGGAPAPARRVQPGAAPATRVAPPTRSGKGPAPIAKPSGAKISNSKALGSRAASRTGGSTPGAAFARRASQDPHSPSRGSALARHKPGGTRGGAGRGRDEFDEETEGPVGPVVLRKKTYPVMISGGVVGFLLGFVIVLAKLRASKDVPDQEKQIVAEANAKDLAARKKLFQDELEAQKKNIVAQLDRLNKKAVPPHAQRDFIAEVLNRDCTSPNAFALAKALLALGPTPGTGRTGEGGAAAGEAEDPETGAEYVSQRDAAKQLYSAGKLGEAIEKLRDNEIVFRVHHAAEIDSLQETWEKEMVARWDRDTEEIDNLAQQGEAQKALDVARKAVEYGDSGIRKEAEAKVRSIEGQIAIQSGQGKTEEGEEATPDLEAEAARDAETSGEATDPEPETPDATPPSSGGAGEADTDL